MVGPPYDCLANPLGAVRLTFEKAVASGSDPTSFDGKDWGAVDLFREFLFDQGALSQVPVLNAKTIRYLQPNTLVRFRGMIQDMLGNEFYAGAYKDGAVWRTNKYTDAFQYPVGTSPDMRIWERRLFYCVPVPGRNAWADDLSDVAITRCMDWTLQHGEKRRRMEDEADDEMDMQIPETGAGGSPGAKKMRESGQPSHLSPSQGSVTESCCFIPCKDSKAENQNLSCLVKIYDSSDSDLKLNDVFEFIGVFTFDYDHQVNMAEKDELADDFCEDASAQFPTNKVPRLHCLVHRKLAIQDFLHSSPSMELTPDLVKNAREGLLGHLSSVLGNDGLAAHFLLLHLLSKVHARVDSLAVGKFSLNLTCFSKESASIFVSQLSLAIKDLLPFTQSIPLTVENLNAASLAPRKDYETNRLITGVMQVPDNSHLIIDETQLNVGTLNSVGIDNARVLKDLIELQKVVYDFKYYKMEVAADIQMLILSEGKSNILPADTVVPFRPSSVASNQAVPKEALEAWRWYLASLRALPHSIDPEMQKVVENDLVAARQSNRSLGSQEFSRLLTMGRLMSLSYGETSLSLENWQMVKELERLRLERFT
ncbi:mini-chromosome maintenance complex-binding protein [Punica granatum]|uniref:Uncharacterized protein n=2 Tax=Punica granatum TaxID=22663 RepID=A0A218WBG6_PUNGR|nr:mini-chromosome maintenance complex-binding protein [Punica granatum]OWM69883.1 hypothetical protein CDL15_Pgr025732 [Punica granatum]PKI40598.1 hypothetical protein CRG98_039008 [Punica granatum]